LPQEPAPEAPESVQEEPVFVADKDEKAGISVKAEESVSQPESQESKEPSLETDLEKNKLSDEQETPQLQPNIETSEEKEASSFGFALDDTEDAEPESTSGEPSKTPADVFMLR